MRGWWSQQYSSRLRDFGFELVQSTPPLHRWTCVWRLIAISPADNVYLTLATNLFVCFFFGRWVWGSWVHNSCKYVCTQSIISRDCILLIGFSCKKRRQTDFYESLMMRLMTTATPFQTADEPDKYWLTTDTRSHEDGSVKGNVILKLTL